MVRTDHNSFGYAYQLPSGGWVAKVRSALSQFSDIFSEFDKYIAPAYHHDRCERSVQMRLYTMHKREFVMVFIAFFACFGLGIFVGIAGPPITVTTEVNGVTTLPKNNSTTASPNRKDIATGPFIMRTPKMSTYAQQLWVIAKLSTENTDGEIIDKMFEISVGISGLTEDHKPVSILDINQNNRTRHLKCEKQSCEEFIVLHLGFLDYTHYIITVNFYGLEAFHSRYNINELYFYFKTYNPGFTQIEIWFRFIFLTFTFIVTCWFQHTLRRYPMYDWSIEQKWMSILLPWLMAYDNPVFPMSFLINSWIPGMIDALAQATFLCALLLFWLCIYHGLRQNDRHFLTFYMPKLFVVGMLWFPAVILSTWQRVNELQDPTYNHTVDTSNFYIVKAFFYIFGVIYLIYLSVLILRAYTELRSMPFFGLRLKFLTLLMLVVLIISCIITVLRFGVGVLEDNFVAQLSTHYTNSSQFMSFYGLLNFYLYAMAYVYSPSNKDIHGESLGITKDNPAFSMINDSDEDVIYGSDEESRRPLNRARNDDDSD
ncbi:transmembrane protein 181 [Anoplophora glabripennis]|uniref:transmembrane protein 181 n=1 Tax=Anoplophora glabripennis TaxID=217634 RepID=UPI00087534DC|nr:transmembrane protein 181 [Anoplophora glabripennis]